MPEKPGEFWNIDLTRLTWSGWLLLVTIGVVVGVVVIEVLLSSALGFRHNPGHRPSRWLGVIALIPALAAGVGVFELGRRLFRSAGCPITRPERRNEHEHD
jgi:hypothetical protein